MTREASTETQIFLPKNKKATNLKIESKIHRKKTKIFGKIFDTKSFKVEGGGGLEFLGENSLKIYLLWRIQYFPPINILRLTALYALFSMFNVLFSTRRSHTYL